VVDQLRNDTENLLNELSDVSARNEELVLAHEADTETIRSLELEVRDWKKKYESAKTELRSIKGMFPNIHPCWPVLNARQPHLSFTLLSPHSLTGFPCLLPGASLASM
jgi:hypothetical protein